MDNRKIWIIGIIIIPLLYILILSICIIVSISIIPPLAWGDKFALGQLVTELLLIPLVVSGFILAIIEFRKSQEKAEFILSWEEESNKDECEVIIYQRTSTECSPNLVLENRGNIVSVWYQLMIDMPRSTPWNTELLTIEGDKNEQGYWADGEVHAHNIIYTFTSKGQYASYPNNKQSLGKIAIPTKEVTSYPDEIVFDYAIHSDKGIPKKGTMKINLIKDWE